MKFNRQALIDALEAQIKKAEETAAAHNAEIATREVDQREEYIKDTESAWLTFANKVIQTVEEGKPVTKDLAPKALQERYGDLKFYVPPSPNGYGYGAPTRRDAQAETRLWRNAVAVLKASTDEHVTSASLKDSGIRNFGALIGGN